MTAPGGGTIADAAVEITADTRRFEPDLRRKMRKAGGQAGKQFDRSFQAEASRGASQGGEDAGRSWADAFRNSIAHRLTGGALSALVAPLAGVGITLGLAALGAQAAAAAAGVVQLAAALNQTSGAALVLPAALSTVVAVAGTLKVALDGVGDAFSAALSGDAEEFADALEELSPAAQSVAREFRALAPEIDDLKESVQDAFFGPLKGQLTEIGEALGGPISEGMQGVAQQAGQVAAGLGGIATEAASVQVIEQIFDTAASALDTMQPGIEAVVRGFRDLIGAALPAVNGLSESLNGVLERFGEWMSQISESGQALEWIQTAFDTLRQFGALLGNIGGALGSVFKAAIEAGGDFLGTLVGLTERMRDFLASDEGQTALVAMFERLSEVSSSLMPVFEALGRALVAIAPVAADIAVALGPGLAAAVDMLGAAIAAAGPGLTTIAQALSGGIEAAAPGVEKLAGAFGDVLDTVGPLVTLLGDLVSAFGGVLADALDMIMPALDAVVEALSTHLAPRLPDIADGFRRIFKAVQPLMEPLGQVLGVAIALAASGVDFFVTSLAMAFEFLGVVLYPVIWLVQQIGDLFEWFVSLIAEFDWNGIFSAIGQAISTAWNWAIEATGAAIGAILDWVIGLPGQILSWLSGLGGQLWDWASQAWNRAWDGMRSAVGALLSWVGSIPGQVLDWLSGLGGQLWDWASEAWNRAWEGMKSGVSSILDWVASLPGQIVDALGDLGGLLFDAGAAILQGFLDGLKSVWDDVTSFIGGIGDWIADNKGPLPYDRVLLVPHGRAIMAGLDEGLRAGIPTVQRTLHGLTRQIPRMTVPVAHRPVQAAPLPAGGGQLGAALAARGATGGYRKEVHVNAPITVHTRASNPAIVAERTVDRLALLAQA